MPMKVTVCFDNVRVIVPCGDGEILVRELINKAIIRYKKATGKSSNHWVHVNNVKTISGGGILDPDDQLSDVVDDREQLIAIFEEQGRIPGHHNGGDGASASSTGTASPDIFQSGESTQSGSVTNSQSSQSNGKTDVVVTPRDLILGSSLTVRRGSEPALNTIGKIPVPNGISKLTVKSQEESRESDEPHSEYESEEEKHSQSNPNTLERKKNKFNRFSRDSGRQSLSNQPDMFRWLEAQERQGEKYANERKGPVGSSGAEEQNHEININSNDDDDDDDDDVIVLINDGGPLGIHVIPDYDEGGRDMGLMIQGIEKGGKVFRDGRLKEEDKIIEINGQSLLQETFKRAQEIFRLAMKNKELRLKVKKTNPALPTQPPPLLPKPKGHSPIKPSPLTLTSKVSTSNITKEQDVGDVTVKDNNKNIKPTTLPLNPDSMPILKPTSPTKRTPPAVPVRHPSTSLTNENKENKEPAFIAPTNTRKIGKKINIELKKGELGLGFSVTSRDNMTGGEIPIYIKNILPQGAAITDGRLKPGDRLLQVNNEEMTGKSQSEAVAFLRKIPKNMIVKLIVSRQETVDTPEDEQPNAATEVSPDDKVSVLQAVKKIEDEGVVSNLQNKEVLLLDIPLCDSGSTGLGVSVKGKSISLPQGSKDLGIFIKSVMPGGAAHKDGRLAINDQLLEINGEKLVGLTNMKAMEKLRNAMLQDGPIPGHTFLTVARKIGAPSPFTLSETSDVTDTAEYVMQGSPVTKGDYSQLPNDRTIKPNNPLLNRLMANGAPGLRNESYTRATQDSFYNDSNNSMDNIMPPSSPFGKVKAFKSPTLNPTNREEVIIENDAYSLPRKNQVRPRPHSTIGMPIKSGHNDSMSSTEELHQSMSGSKHRQSNSLDAGNQHDSDLSPEGDPAGFSREGFGRQSMSEKRKGHNDPRNTEQFWRVRSGREQRTVTGTLRRIFSFHTTGHARSISNTSNIPGNLPTSNLKRSTSLEDLSQPDPIMDDQGSGSGAGSMVGHMINRPRACNESFRAAVDRSYDSQFNQQNPSMDTLDEESFESDAFSHGHSGNSARSSLSSENTTDEHGLRLKKKNVKDKKPGGIFKGFLRLGKGRKSNEEARLRSRSAERPLTEEVDLHQFQREQAWQIAQNEKQRQQELRRQQQQILIDNHRTRQQQDLQGNKSDTYGNKSDTYGNKQDPYSNKQDPNSNKQNPYSNKQDPYSNKQNPYSNKQDPYSNKDPYGHKQEPYSNRQDPYGNKQDIHGNKSDPYGNRQNPFNNGQDIYGNKNEGIYGTKQSIYGVKQNMNSGNTQDLYGARQPDLYGAKQPDLYDARQTDLYGGGKRDIYGSNSVNSQTQFNSLPRPATKTEKIQQLRAEHRRRHQERHGHYPMEEAEEYYERKLLEEEHRRYNRDRSGSDSKGIYARPVSRGQPIERPSNNPVMTSVTNYSPHPSLSDESEYSHSSITNRGQQQQHNPSQHPSHQRTGYMEQYYCQPAHESGGKRIQYRSDSPSQMKHTYYNEPSRSYRDPNYQIYNGRRMPDPGSAKV
ncbi:partitioning defective 3 homolog isoform X2 [Patella vulgata]|uniref:partitioning defective 3 homolog isoform X2 n=1 Tax=Patella vulgata TaxID=6465 RepID=UPI0021807B27|nr:partitioning defective 3 homolog isoform X2 [Patella vulgata]